MKKFLSFLLLAMWASPALAAQATVLDEGSYTYQNRTNTNNNFTELYNIANGVTAHTNPILSGTFTDFGLTLGVPGSSYNANPLIQGSLYSVTVASVNAPKGGTNLDDLIVATSGRKIIPIGNGISVMASGTPATCTAVELACDGTTNGALFVSQGGGNIIAKFPVAALVDTVAAMPFMVASATTYGSAMTRGCPINEGVIASTIGSGCTTMTHIFVQFPYMVQ